MKLEEWIKEVREKKNSHIIVEMSKLIEIFDILEQKQKSIDLLCLDWADDLAQVQNIALKVGISQEDIDGNKYFVPAIPEIVDMIAAKIK